MYSIILYTRMYIRDFVVPCSIQIPAKARYNRAERVELRMEQEQAFRKLRRFIEIYRNFLGDEISKLRESGIEKYFISQVKKSGGWAMKFISPGVSGVPDRIVLLPNGRIFFAELKRPGGKARPLQLAVHRKIEKLGFDVYVIDSKEQVREVLEKYGIQTAQLPADGD